PPERTPAPHCRGSPRRAACPRGFPSASASRPLALPCAGRSDTVWVRPAHCAYDSKSIPWLADGEVGDEYVEHVRRNLSQSLRLACCDLDGKAMFFQIKDGTTLRLSLASVSVLKSRWMIGRAETVAYRRNTPLPPSRMAINYPAAAIGLEKDCTANCSSSMVI